MATLSKHPDNQKHKIISGGLKIWECTIDLLEYLVQNEEIQFENLKVLDLGCGAGILGIYALMKSAQITFQDYVSNVIELLSLD